jgi:hypothetical protein
MDLAEPLVQHCQQRRARLSQSLATMGLMDGAAATWRSLSAMPEAG